MRHKYIVKNIFNEFSTFYLYVSTLQKFCLLLQFLAVHKILKGICTLNKIISKKWQNLLTKKCTKVRPLYFVNWYMVVVLIEISHEFALITFYFLFFLNGLISRNPHSVNFWGIYDKFRIPCTYILCLFWNQFCSLYSREERNICLSFKKATDFMDHK